MPLVAWLIFEVVKDLIIPGIVALGVYTGLWYITTPTGWLNWTNLVRWVETNIKAAAEWVWSGIKENLAAWAYAFEELSKSLAYYEQQVDRFIRDYAVYIITQIIAAVASRVSTIETWRQAAASWMHARLEAGVIALETWRAAFTAWVYSRLLHGLTVLEQWRVSVSTYIHEIIEGRLDTLEAWRVSAAKWLHDTVDGIFSEMDALRLGAADFITTTAGDIAGNVAGNVGEWWKALVQKLLAALSLGAIFTVLADFFNNLFKDPAKKLEDEMDRMDSWEIDPLILAWLAIMKPVVIDKAGELLDAADDIYTQVTKQTWR